MHQPDDVSARITAIVPERYRLVFYGDVFENLSQDVVLERLRLLLKASPESFERRMARLPLTLLPETDRATARRYQQLLARKGITCRIETVNTAAPGSSSFPREASGKSDHQPPDLTPGASSLSSAVDPASGWLSELGRVVRLGVNLCFNPRGVIGRVLSTASYRLTLILAAGVGLVQTANAVADAAPGGTPSVLWRFLAVLLLAPPIGILLVYERGFLIQRAGRFLHGQAQGQEVRTALAWSEIPLLLGGGVGMLEVAMGDLGLAASGNTVDHSLPVLLSQTGFGLLQAACGLWAFILLLHTIAEIQGFSMGRSLASIVLAAVMVVIPLAVVGGVLIGPDILTLG